MTAKPTPVPSNGMCPRCTEDIGRILLETTEIAYRVCRRCGCVWVQRHGAGGTTSGRRSRPDKPEMVDHRKVSH